MIIISFGFYHQFYNYDSDIFTYIQHIFTRTKKGMKEKAWVMGPYFTILFLKTLIVTSWNLHGQDISDPNYLHFMVFGLIIIFSWKRVYLRTKSI